MEIDRQTAKRRLTNRYHEQCKIFPRLRELPLHIYVRRNIVDVMRDGLLADYNQSDLVRRL